MTARREILHAQHALHLVIHEADNQAVEGWTFGPEMGLWPWPSSQEDLIPALSLSVSEARSLVAGLLRGIAIVEAAMPTGARRVASQRSYGRTGRTASASAASCAPTSRRGSSAETPCTSSEVRRERARDAPS